MATDLYTGTKNYIHLPVKKVLSEYVPVAFPIYMQCNEIL